MQSNKDLDLPTQQELLAQFRCDEIASVALAEFNEQAKSQRRPVESGRVVEGLGGMMRSWKSQALGKVASYWRFSLLKNRLQLVTIVMPRDIIRAFMNVNGPISLQSLTQRYRLSSSDSSRISTKHHFSLSRKR